jgi:hypothetical protein
MTLTKTLKSLPRSVKRHGNCQSNEEKKKGREDALNLFWESRVELHFSRVCPAMIIPASALQLLPHHDTIALHT